MKWVDFVLGFFCVMIGFLVAVCVFLPMVIFLRFYLFVPKVDALFLSAVFGFVSGFYVFSGCLGLVGVGKKLRENYFLFFASLTCSLIFFEIVLAYSFVVGFIGFPVFLVFSFIVGVCVALIVRLDWC